MAVLINSGSAPGTPAAGKVEVYTDSSDKRLKSIDETPTTRVFVDRASTETLTNKTISTAAAVTSNSGGVGYETGAGGAVTQLTSKATTVILNKICGQITTHNASLAAATVVSFTLTNSTIAAGDILVFNHLSGGTINVYQFNAQTAAGSATINIRNNTAGALGEALVISFAVIKVVAA